MFRKLVVRLCPNLHKYYVFVMTFCAFALCFSVNAYAASDIWDSAKQLIIDIYGKIVGISTVLAALMSAIAVLGAKMSNNQHKVDQAWDWLRRILIAWAVINGIGAFVSWIVPLFDGYHTLT